MGRYKFVLIFGLSLFALSVWQVFGYDNLVIHPRLAEVAVKIYNKQANQGLTQTQMGFIEKGSIDEDADPRYLNHFYNPETGAGFSDGTWSGLPTIEWIKTQSAMTGDYSEYAILQNYKDGNIARAYQGVGHMLHLIQDMSVPAHTRNDAHPKGDPYEVWAQDYGKINVDKIAFVGVDNLKSKFIELSKYAHDNFYSKNTAPKTGLDNFDIVTDKYNGVENRYLINNNYKLCLLDDSSILLKCRLNDDFKLNLDYWNMLYPKAVGYSAGVIDYFQKQFAKIDEEKKNANQSLGWWQKTKNYLAYTWGDAISASGIIRQNVGSSGSALVDNTVQTSKIVAQATGETILQAKDAVVVATVNTARSTTKAAQSATKAVNDTIKALTPKTTGQVLGIKIVEAQEVSLKDETTISPTIDNQIAPAQQSKGPVLVLWSPPVEEPVAPVLVDTTPPDVSIVLSPSLISSSTSVFFEFNSNEENVSYEFKLDDNAYQCSSATATLENLSEGGHTLSVVAIDTASNTSSSTSFSWFIDSIAPTSSVDSMDAKYLKTGIIVSWLGNDQGASSMDISGYDVQYKIGVSDWVDWIVGAISTSSIFAEVVNNKDKVTFRARAYDTAGNIGEWSQEVQIEIDDGQANHVVISEVQIAGATAKDEFVELYNPTNADINLSGWKLAKRTADATSSYDNLLASFPDVAIKSRSYFLITPQTDFDGGVQADATYSNTSNSIANDNTVILYSDVGQTVVDMVGMGTATNTEILSTSNPPANSSIERKSFATSTSQSLSSGGIDEWQGNGYDSGSNYYDFTARSIANPQNSYSAKEPLEWTFKSKMPTARTSHAGAFNSAEGKIYIVGGISGGQATSILETYDPIIDVWTTETNAQNARWGLMSEVINNNLIVAGGSPTPTGSVKTEAYDCTTDQWVDLSDMPNPGWGVSSSVVNGKLYVIGGYNWSKSGMNVNREYDPALNAWTVRANMPTRRSWAGSGVINNKIYVVGGWDWNDTIDLKTLEVYDPSTDTWMSKVQMPVGMRNMGVTVLNNKLIVFGGHSGSGTGTDHSSVYSYDPVTDSWSRLYDLPYVIAGSIAIPANSGVYLIGGTIGDTRQNTVLYLPMQ